MPETQVFAFFILPVSVAIIGGIIACVVNPPKWLTYSKAAAYLRNIRAATHF
jgi:hypothetical protein